MISPLVSIITPNYNSVLFFKDTFKSVVSQTYNNWEWIIVDDFSSDGSYELILELSKSDNRIKVFRNNCNSGAAVTRNNATSFASGSFIAFLDADDMWKPSKLEEQIHFMIDNNYLFTYTNYDVLTKKGTIKSFEPKKDYADYKTLLKKCDIGCLTVIYNRSALGDVLMPLDTPNREDYAAWLDLTKKGIEARKLNKSLAIYRLSSGAVTANKSKLIKSHWRVYRKHENFSFIKSLFYLFIHSFNKIFFKY